jgi:serine/threonine protein phosphatase 1
MGGRTIAVGDIHGCAADLAALLEAVRPGLDDTLVTLGDFIDRGPDSKGVLDQLIALGGRCRLVPLLGNHEELLLAARSDAWSLEFWLACGGRATLTSYGQDAGLEAIPTAHWAFLEGCQKVHETSTHIFVHAKEGFRLPQEPGDGRPLWPRFSGKVGVVGHTAQRTGEIRDEGFLKHIDTGCHGGGWLTALEVTTGQLWQADQRGRLRRADGEASRGRLSGKGEL